MTSMAGIVLALVLLMALAYRGVSVLVLAPLCALLAVLFSPDAPLFASYTQVFMKALGGFVIAFFPLFLLGAVFGKLMEASGAALAIAQAIVRWLGAQQAVLAIVAACAVLTYGGVSLFVVAFAVFPIAAALFREAQIPKRLIPATIALGAFTFTMTALPGTPAIQNAIPMPFFGTTPFASPGLGLIGGAVMLGFGWWWLSRRAAAARRAGEGYGAEEVAPAQSDAAAADAPPAMPFGMAIAPVVLVIALNYLLSTWLWPALDTSYLAEARFGATSVQAVRGIWAVIGALGAAIVLLTVLWWLAERARRGQGIALKTVLEEGAGASVMPLMNTASQVGFGAVIASLAGFALIRDAVLGIAPGNPLVSMSIAINILAGITGSASGGMSIALQTLGATWLEMGRAAGIAPDLLHRVTAIATGGLDALPHNGAVITLLGICKLTHRQSYLDIFVVAVAVPVLALVSVVTLGSLFGSF
ncbi:MAG: GntP family permease [Methyloversatilis sp.]|uniref:GntP family permease n=1 Tax=Methyloversatilis sp. TaxID=2569862 RepID=UPI0027353DDF|nr:GntP family permease [Methyloversatilis sp.]MDP3874799.1 GntP family permease [Methyloversatilis sp.]